MELFEKPVNPNINLLPYDGTVNYFGKILEKVDADHWQKVLLQTVEWERDVSVIFGKRIETRRKVAWYGDRPFEYTYSNNTKTAHPWTPGLIKLKHLAEQATQETYNSCLLNLYHNGSEGMAWHRDEERDLKENGAIASLSFGAE
ncbi:MAG: alpha-ketoglutarate-dependent dioxygenase AlkB, partial [Marinoscillum sp.]